VDELLKRGVPEFVRNAGKSVFARHVFDRHTDVRVLTLKEKLRQQAVRVAATESRAELLDELAEVLEIVLALGETHGVSLEQLEARRSEQHGARAPHWLSGARGPSLSSAAGLARSGAALAVRHADSSRGLRALRRALSANAVRAVPQSRGSRSRPPSVQGADRRLDPTGAAARPRSWLRSRIHLRALHARKALSGAVTLLGAPVRKLHAPSSALRPRAPMSSSAVRVRPSASLQPGQAARSRYLPVIIMGTGSSAAVWIVSLTSRALLRYVVRPYLVRYLQNAASDTRVDLRAQGSRTLIRLVLPALAT
jgi:predicted house-cleaning noncanonical NTP pyrophosphatase (MazG superfamily)